MAKRKREGGSPTGLWCESSLPKHSRCYPCMVYVALRELWLWALKDINLTFHLLTKIKQPILPRTLEMECVKVQIKDTHTHTKKIRHRTFPNSSRVVYMKSSIVCCIVLPGWMCSCINLHLALMLGCKSTFFQMFCISNAYCLQT